MIGVICSGFRIGVVSKDVPPSCAVVAAIVFCPVLPPSSVSSDPIGHGGSDVVGLSALPLVKALSSPAPSDERSRFWASWSMLFSSLVSILAVCQVLLG